MMKIGFKNQLMNFMQILVLLIGIAGPVSYLMNIGNPAMRTIYSKPLFLNSLSPLPLVFDSHSYYSKIFLIIEGENGELVEKFLPLNFTTTKWISSHVRLHFLRIIVFYNNNIKNIKNTQHVINNLCTSFFPISDKDILFPIKSITIRSILINHKINYNELKSLECSSHSLQ